MLLYEVVRYYNHPGFSDICVIYRQPQNGYFLKLHRNSHRGKRQSEYKHISLLAGEGWRRETKQIIFQIFAG